MALGGVERAAGGMLCCGSLGSGTHVKAGGELPKYPAFRLSQF